MGYMVLWAGCLATCLLLVATIAALGARAKRIHRVGFWPILSFAVVFCLTLLAVVAAGFLWIEKIRPAWLFPYALSFLVCFAIGGVILLRKALKKADDKIEAHEWSRARLAGALGIVFCITAGTFSVMELNARVDQARLYALTVSEAIKLWPGKQPKHLNAAEDYNQAAKAFTGHEFFHEAGRTTPHGKKLPKWFEDVAEADFRPDSEGAAAFLAENRAVLELLHRAGDQPGFHYDLEAGNLIASPIPSFFKLVELGDLLALSAKYKAMNGEPEAALTELSAMEKMAAHLYRTPHLISVMVAAKIDEHRAKALEYVLAGKADSRDVFIPSPVKASNSVVPFYRDAMRMEQMTGMQLFGSLDRRIYTRESYSWFGGGEANALEEAFFLLWRVYMLPDDLLSAVELNQDYDQAYEKPWPQGAKRLAEIEGSLLITRRMGMLTAIGAPLFSPYYTRIHEAAARRAHMDLALAATAYKTDHGEYPADLEALVPDYIDAVPVDPFDMKPMKLEIVEGGMDIYSIGPVEDDGDKRKPIHFYLGAGAYEKYRYQPAVEAREQEAARKKKK